MIEVVVRWPGARAEAVEANVVVPIERALAGAARGLVATAEPDLAVIALEPRDADAPVTPQRVHDLLRPMLAQLPPDAEQPFVQIRRRTAKARYLVEQPDAAALKAWRDRAFTIPGVLGHESCGAAEPELLVAVDPQRLAAHMFDVRDVVSALSGPGIMRPPIAPTILELGDRPVGTSGVKLADVAVLELTTRRDCLAWTSRGRGAVGTFSIAGDDPPAIWKRIVRAAADAGVTVVPLTAPKTITGTAELPPGAPDRTLERFERALANVPGAAWVVVELELERDVPRASIAIGIDDGEPRAAALVGAALPRALASQPASPPMRLVGDGLAAREVPLVGTDLAALRTRALAAVDALRRKRGIEDASCTPCARVPTLQLDVDRDAAARLGVPASAIGPAIQAATSGIPVVVAMDGPGVRVRVRPAGVTGAPPPGSGGRMPLDHVYVKNDRGALVPVEQLVRAAEQPDVGAIRREDGQRTIIVWARAADRATVDRALRAAIPDANTRTSRAIDR